MKLSNDANKQTLWYPKLNCKSIVDELAPPSRSAEFLDFSLHLALQNSIALTEMHKVRMRRDVFKKSMTTQRCPVAIPRIPSARAIEDIATSQRINLKEIVSMSATPGRIWISFWMTFFFGLKITSLSGWSSSWTSSLILDTFLYLIILFSDSFEVKIGEKSDFYNKDLWLSSCCDCVFFIDTTLLSSISFSSKGSIIASVSFSTIGSVVLSFSWISCGSSCSSKASPIASSISSTRATTSS